MASVAAQAASTAAAETIAKMGATASAATASSSAASAAAAETASEKVPHVVTNWTVNDIIKNDGEITRSTILKFDHPFRLQRVMIVPTPRFASEEFYKDWCYQPYVKDHQIRVSNEIFNPAFVAIPRLLINSGRIKGMKYFTPLYMPDAIDNNVSRRVFISREQNFNTFVLYMMLTTNTFRERWHPWITKKTRKLVGERYLSHPKEDKQSFVVLVPPHYAATMANTLQELGFKLADSVEVPAGETKELKKLYFWGDVCLFAVLSYFWIVISVMIVNESIRMYYSLREYQAHLIMVAGKDPKLYGYTEKECEVARERIRVEQS